MVSPLTVCDKSDKAVADVIERFYLKRKRLRFR
jgi:hypothetical protein